MDTILNMSGVYGEEGWSPDDARIIDLQGLEGSCCYCDPQAAEAIRAAIADIPPGGIHWTDTGDYHYISKLWMEKIDYPFVLALFDNHPDDQEGAFGGELLSCGGWVLSSRRELPMMKADFLNTPDIPGELPVYLSLDLDILSREHFRAGWSQGSMTPGMLLAHLDRIAASHPVIGVDICGGLSVEKGATAGDLRINVATRRVIARYFSSHPLLSGQSSESFQSTSP